MGDTIPISIVREIISEILIERSNVLMRACEELMQKEMLEHGTVSDFPMDVGTESCGTRVLADEVLYGEISIEEAVREVLTADERKEAKYRCRKWLDERKGIEDR